MKKLYMVFLFCSMLACTANAFNTIDIFKGMFEKYLGIGAIVFAIGTFLTALVYMIGNFLMNDKIKEWAKAETVELFYSAVLFGIIISICAMGTDAAASLLKEYPTSANIVCNNDIPAFNTFEIDGKQVDSGYAQLPCHLRVAKNFLASIFYETAGLVKAVGITQGWYAFLSSISFNYIQLAVPTVLGAGSLNFSPFAFLNAKNNALSFIFENAVKILTIVRFQEILINFIGIALFPVLLASGLILRTFSLTRKLGGLLMALALSLYFIYPVFYIIGDMVYNSAKIGDSVIAKVYTDFKDIPLIGSTATPAEAKPVSNFETNKFLTQMNDFNKPDMCTETLENVENKDKDPNPVQDQTGIFSTWLAKLYKKGGANNPFSFHSVLVGIDALAKALFFSLFFGFLSIFATIAAVKTLSPMLGGDTEIAGLTHLV